MMLYQMIVDFIGDLPVGYEWITGVLAIVLFVWVTHLIFEVIATLFGYVGGGHNGRSY